MMLTQENNVGGDKIVPMPLCAPQIPQGMASARPRPTAVEGRARHVTVCIKGDGYMSCRTQRPDWLWGLSHRTVYLGG